MSLWWQGKGRVTKRKKWQLRSSKWKKHLACAAKKQCSGTGWKPDHGKLDGRIGTDFTWVSGCLLWATVWFGSFICGVKWVEMLLLFHMSAAFSQGSLCTALYSIWIKCGQLWRVKDHHFLLSSICWGVDKRHFWFVCVCLVWFVCFGFFLVYEYSLSSNCATFCIFTLPIIYEKERDRSCFLLYPIGWSNVLRRVRDQ